MKEAGFRRALMGVAGAMVLAGAVSARGNSIVTSLHNLSVSGPGAIKATGQTEICIFCHIPHNARADIPYLWNRQDPAGPYTPYYSTTLKATVGQPTGTSRLCLSCHDGTIAPGAVLSQSTPMPFTATLAGRSSNLGTNLADDHPVSFDYAGAAALPNSQLAGTAFLPSTIRLDAAGQMQCTACHNPHNDQYGKFLVMSNLGAGLCISCHSKTNWNSSSHAVSGKLWNGSLPDPWPHSEYTTVADNGCSSCHRPHTASGPQRLLQYSVEETNCLVCHNGNVAAKDITVDLDKPYRHPVSSYSGVHDPAENYAGVVSKHVECVDCHNPHQANSTTYAAPLVPGRLMGVPAVTEVNTYLPSATYEYEICFKCHGALLNNVLSTTATPRVYTITDNRIKFATSNPSYHPVMGPLNKISDNMLLAPWAKGSMVYCTDCHGSDSSGIRGSHGSIYPHILVARYETSEVSPSSYNGDDYALCFKCHNPNTLYGFNTKFPQHKRHLEGHAVKDRCNYCHDPHGSPHNPGMINFNTLVVSPNGSRPIQYIPPVTNRNSCVLVCHGVPHG
jgi:predicted CXXCH cytochrome family protein